MSDHRESSHQQAVIWVAAVLGLSFTAVTAATVGGNTGQAPDTAPRTITLVSMDGGFTWTTVEYLLPPYRSGIDWASLSCPATPVVTESSRTLIHLVLCSDADNDNYYAEPACGVDFDRDDSDPSVHPNTPTQLKASGEGRDRGAGQTSTAGSAPGTVSRVRRTDVR